MVWLLVIAIVLLALLLLVLAAAPVLRRLAGLRRARVRLDEQVTQLRTVQTKALTLQQRVATMQEKSDQTTRRLAAITSRTTRSS